jgi:hypothetical protein
MEKTQIQEDVQKDSKSTPEPEVNENFKYRLERAKEQGAKQVLSDLGLDSIKSAKEKIELAQNLEKQVSQLNEQISKAKVFEYKTEVLQSGFDDKFVDFVLYAVKEKVTENENFSSLLAKFKQENPQYLRNQESNIKFSTSPNFEKVNANKDFSKLFNEAILRKIHKE